MKNYFQRRIDSGETEFANLVVTAESKKERGEPTGPLPIPNTATKRRYEATPSTVIPRPLAPHTEAGAHPDVQLEGKKKGILAPLRNTPPLHTRTAPSDKDRGLGKSQPLAQPGSTPAPTIGPVHEEPRLQQRLGPRIGYFTEERRETPTLYMPASQQSGLQPSLSVADKARAESHVRPSRFYDVKPPEVHGSPLLPVQGVPLASEQTYVQPHQPRSISSLHSRHPSLTKVPGSPSASSQTLEPETPPVQLEPFGIRQQFPAVAGSLQQSHPFLPSPAVEPTRPPSTPVHAVEPSRHVPAKRSNIMSLLNDEPDDPPPRKRYASEQAAGAPSPRPAYPSLVHQDLPRQEELYSSNPRQRPMGYSQQSQYLSQPPQPTQPRTYSDYAGYSSVHGSTSGGIRAKSDWVSRFDPRGQQPQQPVQTQHQHILGGFSGGRSAAQPVLPPQDSPLPSISVPARAAPTPPPASSQRPRISSLISGPRDVSTPSQVYRPTVGSPPQSSSSLPYLARRGPSPPTQSPVSILNLTSRQPSGPTPSSSTHPAYSQHVSSLSHQPHPSTLGLPGPAGGQFSVSPPPPPGQISSLAGPPPSTLPRSYTPPAVLHPNPTASAQLPNLTSYGVSSLRPSTPSIHTLKPRYGSGTTLAEPSGPLPHDHHRYSQETGQVPGPLSGPPRGKGN